MAPAQLFRVSRVVVVALAFCVASIAQSGNPVTDIQAKLSSQFKVTTIAADRSDIVTAGDVVQIHKPGLVMYAVASPLPPSNTYKNGKITKSFGMDVLNTMLAPGAATSASYPQRTFVPEEKCWLTGIQVQKDGVLVQLYSDPYDDTRYYANLKIPFPNKKEVPPVDAALQLVAEVLTVVPPDDDGGQQSTGTADGHSGDSGQGGQRGLPGEYTTASGSRILLLADGSFTKFVGGGQGHGQYAADGDNLTLTFTSTGFSQRFKVQGGNLFDVNTHLTWARTGDAPPTPPTPLPDIAPPPPPADTPPPTIAVGQTKEQVTAAFGQPVKAAKIGAKDIFYYKDMKVTFMNGKVSNVE
jgi:hypothetical protein